MKNKMIMKTIRTAKITLLGFIAVAVSFASCSDWNEVESIDVVQPNIEQQNPALYAQYLEHLKAYKNSDHKLTYAWFDNSVKVPFNRAQHITEIPDSIDVVALMYPDQLVDRELEEMAKIRADKGTQIIYSIDYDAIKLIYDTRAAEQPAPEAAEEGAPSVEFPDFLTFLVDTIGHTLKLADQYQYDGLSIAYLGKSMLHLTEQERKEYIENQNVFIGMITAWAERHTNKLLVFEGHPQNLIDKTILSNCQTILIPMTSIKNEYQFTYNMTLAQVEGVPTDRFGIKVAVPSLNKEDTKTGYLADGSRALGAASQWIMSQHDGYIVKGLGIQNVNNDYYNPALVYKYTRNAITTLNPSIKN